MNADDEKKLKDIWSKPAPNYLHYSQLLEAYALGRRAGMTEAAGICEKVFPKAHTKASENSDRYAIQDETTRLCATAIEKARDA